MFTNISVKEFNKLNTIRKLKFIFQPIQFYSYSRYKLLGMKRNNFFNNNLYCRSNVKGVAGITPQFERQWAGTE